MSHRPARVSVTEVKRKLQAAGISTSGIVEKEELLRMLSELDAQGENEWIELPITYMMGCAYAAIDDPRCAQPLQLLVDTGAAVSIVASQYASQLSCSSDGRVELGSARSPKLRLECAVASPQQQLPPGVDGIFGFDAMRSYGAVELDWGASSMRLHTAGCSVDTIVASWHGQFGSGNVVSIPIELRRVSAGLLPFARATFGEAVDGGRRCEVEALVDTGCAVQGGMPGGGRDDP